MKPIKLNKEQAELLTTSPEGFVVYAYLSYQPNAPIRQISRDLHLSRAKCHRLIRAYRPSEASPPRQGKAEGEQVELFNAPTTEAEQSLPPAPTARPAMEENQPKQTSQVSRAKPPAVGAVYNVGLSVGDTRYKDRQRSPAPPASLATTPEAPPQVRLKADGTPISLHTQLVEVFDEFYKYKNEGVSFAWDGKHIRAIQELRKKLTKSLQDQRIQATDEAVVQAFITLLKSISNPWVLDNLSPATLNSKYNELRSQQQRATSNEPTNELDALRASILGGYNR